MIFEHCLKSFEKRRSSSNGWGSRLWWSLFRPTTKESCLWELYERKLLIGRSICTKHLISKMFGDWSSVLIAIKRTYMREKCKLFKSGLVYFEKHNFQSSWDLIGQIVVSDLVSFLMSFRAQVMGGSRLLPICIMPLLFSFYFTRLFSSKRCSPYFT